MLISSTYICPVRGLTGLEPPEADRLGQAAGVAKNLGIERLLLPVLEESLIGSVRSKVTALDGFVQALDRIAEAGLTAWLIAPAQKVLGLNWVPPYLASAVRDPKASPVFVDRRVRNLRPFDWWADPTIIKKRIGIFREVMTALNGHPALKGWLILDRAMEWVRPGFHAADIMLRAFLAEIRDRDESSDIYLGLGWSELLDPEITQILAGQVNGLHVSGLEHRPPDIGMAHNLAGELIVAAYLGRLAQWLFECPAEVEIGWGMLDRTDDLEEIVEAGRQLAERGPAGTTWLSLIDPQPGLYGYPPWRLRPGLEGVGLLNHGVEPKEEIVALLEEFRSTEQAGSTDDFIDISREEYLEDPYTHLPRLWEHFRESL